MLTTQSHRPTSLLDSLEGLPGQTVGRLGEMTLSSHFQPIYSLSHMRVVGHEALLRAKNARGQHLPPPEVFSACRNEAELTWCDSLSRTVHLANFTAVLPPSQWLFLNVHPDVFQSLCRSDGDGSLTHVIRHFGLSGEKLVLEVLESAVTDPQTFEMSIDIARRSGCLIAIDDFGAGHSNFDRVWRFRPDIVKLDRSLVERAARDRRAQRVVSQMVSLLHECGAVVLMEGVETIDEAMLAMESDADLVQGYFFGRPQPHLVPTGHAPETLTRLYAGLSGRHDEQRLQYRNGIGPYHNAIGNAGVLLSAGRSLAEACQAFLDLPGADICYMLDAGGFQIGDNVWSSRSATEQMMTFEPLRESEGACWARRPYFRRAIASVGKVQITRPYRSLNGHRTCITVSCAFYREQGGERVLRVICGDLTLGDETASISDQY
jgi:EAL domain-containing protein (putative c-di-GMP-specific phosphodiesterase class I)